MPLVMSMRPGDDFFVGDDRIVMGTIRGKQGFEIVVDKTGAKHNVTESEAIEVLPDVFVSSGPRPSSGIARVAIDAPQEVMILRGDRYRAAFA